MRVARAAERLDVGHGCKRRRATAPCCAASSPRARVGECPERGGAPIGRRERGQVLPEETPAELAPEALAALGALVGDDPEFLAELVDEFLDSTPAQLEELGTSLESGDLDTARRLAHTLKSTAATFGATVLSDACRSVEAAAKDDDLEGARAGLPALTSAYADGRLALEGLRATLPS